MQAAAQTATPQATAPPQQPATPAGQQPVLQPHDDTLPEQGQTSSITVFSNEVDLIFTVAGKNGHFVTGLQQQAFGLLDDGKPPIRVRSFTQQTNLPLRVGVMLDTSNSIRQRFQFEQQAATDFFLQVMHPADSAFVEGFDVSTDVTQDFTNRIDLLDTGIMRLRPGGGTALFDSLYKTCRDQMLTIKEKNAVRKALVLVSDGDDDQPRPRVRRHQDVPARRNHCVYHLDQRWPERRQRRRRPPPDRRRHRRPGLLPQAHRGSFHRLPEHRGRASQPIPAGLRSRRLASRMARSAPSTCTLSTPATRSAPRRATSPPEHRGKKQWVRA